MCAGAIGVGGLPRGLFTKPEQQFPRRQAITAQHRAWHTIDVLWIERKAALGFPWPAEAPCVLGVKKVGDPSDFPLLQLPGTFCPTSILSPTSGG